MEPVDKAAAFFTCFAAILWCILVVAAVAMALGDEDAINALVGGGIPTVFVTAAAVGLRVQDRRHARRHSAP